jgi:hypothetical protein
MRIFISSTYRDLQSEREKAKEALEKMDLLTRRMEIFVSEPNCPATVALRELQESDALVLIIGFKAGSLLEETVGLTYTRAEFERASELGKPIFVFIKTQDRSWRNDEETPRLREALDKFKAAAQTRQTPAHFANADELMTEVILAIGHWEELGRPGARSTFATWSEYFPLRSGLFDYDQELRGRSAEFAFLTDFLADDAKAAGVMIGRGGVGKSKLLRDWSRQLAGWTPLFVREGAVWHAESSKEVPAGKILIIADDAHRIPDLPRLLNLARELSESRACKLLLCARPSGTVDVDDGLARTFDAPKVARFPILKGLELPDSVELAKEVLGSELGYLADQLASVSGGTPLVTVVGGRLIAQRHIPPLLLANEEEFRRAVFDKYLAEYERLLPPVPFSWRTFLALIAALSPLHVDNGRFLNEATGFLRLRPDEILQAATILEKHGLLLRRQGAVRIVPDVLSDYILEQACLQSNGTPTQLADEVFSRFRSAHLSMLLRNLAELDWRIAHKNPSSGLLDHVWMRFFEDYQQGDSMSRVSMLDSFAGAAFFQPARAIELARYSIANPGSSSGEHGWFGTSHVDVLHKLPGILEAAAYHGAYLEPAVRLLWDLAQKDTRETNPNPKHALRVLQSLASYGRYKSVDFYLRLADVLASLATDPHAFESRYTPLDVVNKLLEKEGEHRESDGLTLRIGGFALVYDRVRAIRVKAIGIVEGCLAMENPRAAASAVDSLSRLLAGFLPGFGRKPTDDELAWQDAERLEVLGLIARRLQGTTAPIPLLRELRRMLLQFGRRTRRDAVQAAADELIGQIGYSNELYVYDVFCTDRWDFDVISNTLDSESNLRERAERAKELLRQKTPNAQGLIAALEEMFSQAASHGIDARSSSLLLFEALCDDEDFRSEFSRYVFSSAASVRIAFQIRTLLPGLRRTDPIEYRRIGVDGARGVRAVALGVAHAICFNGWLQNPMAVDLEILGLLSQHDDPDVRSNALTGIRALGRIDALKGTAIPLALAVDLGKECELAEDLAGVFHPSNVDPACLTPGQIRVIFEKLVPLGHLDGNGQSYYLSEFLEWACQHHPDATFEFIIARLDYAATLRASERDRQSYEAVSSPDIRPQFRGFGRTPQYSFRLSQVRDRLLGEQRYVHDLVELFWSMGDSDSETLAVLDAWLHPPDETRFREVLRLIAAGPEDLLFKFPYFAVHVSHSAAEFGEEVVQEAIGGFVARSRHRAWNGTPSEPPGQNG